MKVRKQKRKFVKGPYCGATWMVLDCLHRQFIKEMVE